MANKQSQVAADEGLNGLWRQIKHLLPKTIAKKKHNIRCTGPTAKELTQNYCSLEAGEEIEYDNLLKKFAAQQRTAADEQPLAIDLQRLPTRLEIEKLCRQAKRVKAPGLDSVQAEVLQHLMREHSEIFFFLVFKSWLLAAEPLQFKGDTVHSIMKKTGLTTASGMRGITLLDTLGKVYHSLIRTKVLPWLEQTKLPTQFGGFRGQQTAFASLVLSSFEQVTAAHKISLATVFLDVRSAFHCLLRQHAFGSDEVLATELCRVLCNEGLDVQALVHDIRAHSAAFVDHIDEPTARVVQDAHKHTWFVCPQSPTLFETHRGSRPGSPLADLAYNALMCDLLKTLHGELQQVPRILEASLTLEIPAPVLAWVDDVALLVPCCHADCLDDTLETVMLLTHRIFGHYGLRLNCEKGKTEAILQHRGKDSAQLRRNRFVDDFGMLEVKEHAPSRIVSQYVHLGITIAQSTDICNNINQKIGKASNAYRLMSKAIFSNQRLAVSVRLKLLESLVLPIVFYGAGSWTTLATRMFNRLEAAIVKWQRRIIGNGFWSQDTISDAEPRATWKLPCLASRLTKHRLLFLLQLHQHAPSMVWDTITAADALHDDSW